MDRRTEYESLLRELDGLDIALVKEMARRLGLTVNVIDIAFDGLIEKFVVRVLFCFGHLGVDDPGRDPVTAAGKGNPADFERSGRYLESFGPLGDGEGRFQVDGPRPGPQRHGEREDALVAEGGTVVTYRIGQIFSLVTPT